MLARYDGSADWYDRTFGRYGELDREGSSSAHLARLLGPGGGLCLDVACGTGLHFRAVASTGRTVVGADLSRDQLRIAGRRAGAMVRADAARLPPTRRRSSLRGSLSLACQPVLHGSPISGRGAPWARRRTAGGTPGRSARDRRIPSRTRCR